MGEIRKNQKVKLTFTMSDESEKEVNCLIKEVFIDRLTLTINDEVLKYAEYLEEGEELIAKVFTPSGVKLLNTIVLDSPTEQEFVIEYAEVSAEVQRREYTRVQLTAKVVIQRNHHENIVTNTIDVSGGGLRFAFDGNFNSKEEVSITLYLPDTKLIQAKGHIIKNNQLPVNVHILSFSEISENDRDKILKKCFEIQTKSLEM